MLIHRLLGIALSVIHLLCTDNGKHLLMYKLMYISCLLTVKAGNITYW